ncbi:hypothetical protein FIBSPDRAFT_1040829 [Athelia psychrophila]|uniref:Uncharacterized protein n=1 Tax=Athelia psychrophila TaxID=1759441 RepID=A0A166PNL1_9AGAM|nr:hypothetical protein FIBSPDRAFT_1040829 [Fibularhizoctonia sp. CBS 109695]
MPSTRAAIPRNTTKHTTRRMRGSLCIFSSLALAILATCDTVRAGYLSTANSNARRLLPGKPVPRDLSDILDPFLGAWDTATLTNPDQASTAFTVVCTFGTAAPTAPALPSGMPTQIHPGSQIASNTDLNGYTPIVILFDLDLSWQFETSSSDAPNQMFAYMPAVIAGALGIDQSQVMTYYLQVFQPVSYQNASDVAQLVTEYVAYIPSDSSIGEALAGHVYSSFAIDSVTPDSESGSSGDSGNSVALPESPAVNTMQDAIIGVAIALGPIALAILALLLYRGWKRRQELAHHRLADPSAIGARPSSRKFDYEVNARGVSIIQEDSLSRGQAQASDTYYDYRASPNTNKNMRERRPVLPAHISTPYLQHSSMDW